MQLKKLTLKNFKGIKNFELDAKGQSVDIYGDNETGKTTIFDSVTWLLFDKDSLNSANFDIKTLTPDGQPIHKLEHSVEGVFSNVAGNGNELTLRKVFYEKYTKKRGQATREFTGHNTDHFIDGVPVSMTEYKNQIKDICDETLFKLLSNPRYFNEVLHWQERRKMLLGVCGDITDEDVINSNDELKDLPGILLNRKLEDHRKVIASRRAEINKELDKIPVRIDEISSSEVNVRDKSEIKKNLAEAREEKKTAEEVLKEIRAGGESEVLTTKLREVENSIQEIDNSEANTKIKAMTAKANERQELKRSVDDLKYSIELIEKDKFSQFGEVKKNEERIKVFGLQIDQVRKNWYAEDSKQFEFKQSDKCPTCGQDLPKEKFEVAREHALESFNKSKADKLAQINNEGKSIAATIEAKKTEIEGLIKKLTESDKVKLDLYNKLDISEKALKDFDEQKEANSPDNPERLALLRTKEEIKKQIEEKKGLVDPAAIAEGESQIEGIDIRIKAYEKELLQTEANARIDVRVKELSDQERTLSAEFEELERQLYLTDQFVRTKVGMLEEKINEKFELANFQLFTTNINLGLEECCNTTYNGVPYNSLNFGMRLNCGIDICRTLSKHFGKNIPMFLDNAESVTSILSSESQQIKLIVSPKDKELRVENGKSA